MFISQISESTLRECNMADAKFDSPVAAIIVVKIV